MRSYIIHIFILISTTISYGQNSGEKIDVRIYDNELGLVLTNNKRYVLESGKHLLDPKYVLIKFNKVDSLKLDKFDILDLNTQSLFCQVQIKYSLTPKHIKNIADLLEWSHNIEAYKKILVSQKIKSEIREIAENYKATDLIKSDYKENYQIEFKSKEAQVAFNKAQTVYNNKIKGATSKIEKPTVPKENATLSEWLQYDMNVAAYGIKVEMAKNKIGPSPSQQIINNVTNCNKKDFRKTVEVYEIPAVRPAPNSF